ncbi:MAG: hypothetical protein BWY75_03588 [bacterium ADurb.Bin425]|nr:MAG: hypothetical protein BWY75_03588 [bacterium ADurb.Bin425]
MPGLKQRSGPEGEIIITDTDQLLVAVFKRKGERLAQGSSLLFFIGSGFSHHYANNAVYGYFGLFSPFNGVEGAPWQQGGISLIFGTECHNYSLKI